MDLTIALVWWPVGVLESGAEWPVLTALAATRLLRLTAPEIAATPALYVLYAKRGYTALIHRLGRPLQGLSPMTHVIARAKARSPGKRLVATVAEALADG